MNVKWKGACFYVYAMLNTTATVETEVRIKVLVHLTSQH